MSALVPAQPIDLEKPEGWWLTASEIAALCAGHGVDLPHTKRKINDLLKRSCYSAGPQVRRRKGKGGGLEYRIVNIDVLEPLVRRLMAIAHNQSKSRRDTSERTNQAEVLAARDASVLNSHQRKVMHARLHILNAIDQRMAVEDCTQAQAIDSFLDGPERFGISTDTIRDANDRARENASISRRTLFRWIELAQSGVAALAPLPSGNRQEVPAWFWDFFQQWAKPAKPTLTRALADYRKQANAVSPLPSYDAIRRIMKKIGNVERHRGREGALTIKARMAYVVRSTADLFPGCVYTGDGKTFDAEIAHPIHGRPFRPEITSIVDVATRKCVGFSVDLDENSRGVADALRHACVTHGICAIFYVDNGSGFKNKYMEDVSTGIFERLGISVHHSIAYNSQARGIIERFNGSVWNPLSKLFDSYVGRDMDREARLINFKVTRKDLKEFGTSRKLPSWEDFLDACNEAIGEYNARPHSSLPHNMSPDDYWAYHVSQGFERVEISQAEADDLFRPYEKRRVRRCLIEFRNNRYFSLDLTEHHGDDVMIGIDIHDASKVWVREIDFTDQGEKPGRLICIAEFAGNEKRYIPHSMQQQAMEKRNKARVKRLEDKLDVVAQELRPSVLLEQSTEPPMQVLPGDDEASGILQPANTNPTIEHEPTKTETDAPRNQGRRVFGSDAELAHWAIENPGEVSEGQRSVLQECLRSRTDRDLLELEGVNLDRLKAVIRTVA